jgi:hypothetical protein
MKRMALAIFAIALSLTPSGPAAATGRDDDAARRTLAGITRLGVVVQPLPDAADRVGLRREDVQADLQQFIGERRIKLIAEEKVGDLQTAYLTVRCELVPLEKEQRLVYAITLDLLQPAVLASGQRVHASTWSECQAGITRRPSPDDLRAVVKDVAGVFVNAYLEANPRPEKKD